MAVRSKRDGVIILEHEIEVGMALMRWFQNLNLPAYWMQTPEEILAIFAFTHPNVVIVNAYYLTKDQRLTQLFKQLPSDIPLILIKDPNHVSPHWLRDRDGFMELNKPFFSAELKAGMAPILNELKRDSIRDGKFERLNY